MAANNYFGYSPAGTPFATSTPTSYPTSQTPGYPVQHTTQAYAAAAAPRANPTAYESYQGAAGHGAAQVAAAAAAYQYASRQQNTYDKAQSYYPQAAQVGYTAADTTHYQTGAENGFFIASKATYSAGATGYGTTRAAGQKNQTAAVQSATASYAYPTAGASTGYAAYQGAAGATSYATSMYVQPTAAQQQATAAAIGATTAAGVAQSVSAAASAVLNKGGGQSNAWGMFKKGGFVRNQKPKQAPKPQQLHYCDVCKISCAGPQTYREHLEGQKHKKKEAAAKAGQAPPPSRGGTSLRCELCDVTCTGSDAYAAHIRGTKHQKVVKLHTKLGKPIPSTEPVVLATNNTPKVREGKPKGAVTANGKKVLGTPKINFVGGTKLSTTTAENLASTPSPSSVSIQEDKVQSADDDDSQSDFIDDKDVQPVGQDYIEEISNEEGKVISFQCKLCECRFNDPNAKEMHMKGRRHRMQYKKKVDPNLLVDIKPSLRHRKIQEDRMRRLQYREDMWKRREEERWRDEMRMMEEEERCYWEERRRYEEEMEYYDWFRRYGRDPHLLPPPPMMPPRGYNMGPPRGPPMGPPPPPPRRPDSVDDRHIMAKHTLIYPKEDELACVQKIVTNAEKALKHVSDHLAEIDTPKPEVKVEVKVEPTTEETTNEENKEEMKKEEEPPAPPQVRALKGVMRVGVLAKGLLLTGDNNVELVVMCAEKPTATLLNRVAENLPKQLESESPDEKYLVERLPVEAAIKIVSMTEPKVTVTIMLTSPVMREEKEKEDAATGSPSPAVGELVKDPPDVLDRQKCLDALAALRHAKWFQARASILQSCVMVIRIMRDLCQRVPTWGRLSNWAMELLVEKVICSSGQYLSSGDALRRVFEAIAGGILLPGGPGILDPCEKEPNDATEGLTNQDREDITSSAQYALRLIAFRQIHKVLGMDAIPPTKFPRGPFIRKRRRENSTGDGTDTEEIKKDKKDDSTTETPMETATPN